MSHKTTRRQILGWGAGALTLTAVSGVAQTTRIRASRAEASARIVVIGGGAAGGVAAVTVKAQHPSMSVTLIERDPTRLAPRAAAGLGPVQGPALEALTAAKVDIAVDEVVGIDWAAKQAVALSGRRFAFDHLIAAPGISARDEGIDGYDRVAAHEFPHAWTDGTQAHKLEAQVRALTDGGMVIVRAPEGAQRFMAGPYQRAERFARHLAEHNPRGKVLILDDKNAFPDQAATLARWNRDLKGLIEWVPADTGGRVEAVDVSTGALRTAGGWVKGDVINFIPAQQAGTIALNTGLTDASGWCPVDAVTLRSTAQAHVTILGDANTTAPVDKTAAKTNDQAISMAEMLSA